MAGPKLSFNASQKRRASSNLGFAWSRLESSGTLLKNGQYRETVGQMYFACFYAGQSLLADRLGSKASHDHVERQLHRSARERGLPPQRYLRLHTKLHRLRNTIDYQATLAERRFIQRSIKQLAKYLRWVSKIVPRLELPELLASIVAESGHDVADFSYDIYEPQSYFYDVGPRVTLWLPFAALLDVKPKRLVVASERLLRSAGFTGTMELAVGINSKLNQYEPVHVLLLDIDSDNDGLEEELAKIGGYLIKTRRGFHFVGKNLLKTQKEWEAALRKILNHRQLKGMVDLEHIELSLKRGYSTLRITETPAKPFTPFFVKELQIAAA